MDYKNIFTNFEGFSLSRKRKYTWVENVFTLYKSPIEQSHEYVGATFRRATSLICFIIATVVLILLLSYSFYLQIFKGEYFGSRAEYNRTRHVSIPAERGDITDRFGVLLTSNIPRFALYIIPHDIPKNEVERTMLINVIATTLNKDAREISELVISASLSHDREVLLYDNISRSEALALSVRGSQVSALQVMTSIQREYVSEFSKSIESFSHVLGYEGKITAEEYEKRKSQGYGANDRIGKQGIEASYESLLRGVKGDKVLEVNANGVSLITLSEIAPKSGATLKLTIDGELQRQAEQALKKQLKQNNKKAGVVIVEGARTGEILALVSLPGFDNTGFSRGLTSKEFSAVINDSSSPLIHRAVSGQYPSGSVIKPLLAFAGLEDDIINEKTTINSTGGIHVSSWFFPDWKIGGHGVVDVRSAIANSVNTFFYMLGGGLSEDNSGLGIDRIIDWMKRFGLGAERGIDVPTEEAGFIPTPQWKKERFGEQWYIGDTYNISIGQGGLLVTPLQISGVISSIINDGVRLKPHLVRSIKFFDGTVKNVATEKVGYISGRKEYFEIVREGMRETVTSGSARSLEALPISSAGKTGTAQSTSGKAPHAWFVGFAPYERPDIIVTVLVEEGEEGSKVSVPIAKKIFEWWAERGITRYSVE